ncbi:MAG: class I SAM-dependent methyltransferase [Candidatus Altiarchaeota archaeon]
MGSPAGNGCLVDRILKKCGALGIVDLWASTDKKYIDHHENFLNLTEEGYSDDLIKHMRDVSGLIGVDIGSGGGVVANRLASLGASVNVMDISLNAVRHATSSGRVLGVQANVEHMPYKDDAFDFCVCTDVVEHVVEYHQLVSEIQRVLKRSGVAYLTVPNAYSCKNLLLDLIFPILTGVSRKVTGHKPQLPSRGHINLFSRKSFATFLSESGFIIEAVEGSKVKDISRYRLVVNPLSTLAGFIIPSMVVDELMFMVTPE